MGGHIRGSTHVPTPTLDYRLPELVRTLQDKETVVFHCALSQQRGPGAALRYLREREKKVEKGEVDTKIGGEEGEQDIQGGSATKKQIVYVLDGGFVKWQEK